ERPDGDTDLSRHIFADHHLTEEQRQAMMRIYLSFRHENEDQASADLSRAPAEAVPTSAQASGPTGAVASPEANGSTSLAG
ncbi:MAG TPA: hypothetical protein VHW93_04495, partial [Acidimicrobiales bacterium]|nr:hypothetical protein [Acidimicrobiales bacterium]